MSTEKKPKPCPFCGKQPNDDHDPVARRISCSTASCAMASFGASIESWNKRAEFASDSLERKELIEALKLSRLQIQKLAEHAFSKDIKQWLAECAAIKAIDKALKASGETA